MRCAVSLNPVCRTPFPVELADCGNSHSQANEQNEPCAVMDHMDLHRESRSGPSLDFAPPCPEPPISRVFAAISGACVLAVALLALRARLPI